MQKQLAHACARPCLQQGRARHTSSAVVCSGGGGALVFVGYSQNAPFRHGGALWPIWHRIACECNDGRCQPWERNTHTHTQKKNQTRTPKSYSTQKKRFTSLTRRQTFCCFELGHSRKKLPQPRSNGENLIGKIRVLVGEDLPSQKRPCISYCCVGASANGKWRAKSRGRRSTGWRCLCCRKTGKQKPCHAMQPLKPPCCKPPACWLAGGVGWTHLAKQAAETSHATVVHGSTQHAHTAAAARQHHA